MENTVDILNNSKEKLTIIRYSVPVGKILDSEGISQLLEPYLTESVGLVSLTGSVIEIALDFGFGSYALIDNLRTLIPENLVIAKIPFKHFISPEHFPHFVRERNGTIHAVFPNSQSEFALIRALHDIAVM